MHRRTTRNGRALWMVLGALALTTSAAWAAPLNQNRNPAPGSLWTTLLLLAAIATFIERLLEVIWDRWEKVGLWPNPAGVLDPSDPEYVLRKKAGSRWLGSLMALMVTGLTNVLLFRPLGFEVLFSSSRVLLDLRLGGMFDHFTTGTLVDWVLTSAIIGWGGTELAHGVIEGLLKARGLWKERRGVEASRRSILDARFFQKHITPSLEERGVSANAIRQAFQALYSAGVSPGEFIRQMRAGQAQPFLGQLEAQPHGAEAARTARLLLQGMPADQVVEVSNILSLLTPEQQQRFLGLPPRRPRGFPAPSPPAEPPVPASLRVRPPAPQVSPVPPQARPRERAPRAAPAAAAGPTPAAAVTTPTRTPSSARALAFIYGRPVRPGEFLDRDNELRTIFNRLRHSESTAIVGEPHIGKSSLLLKVADPTTRRVHLGEDAQNTAVCLMDLHPIGATYNPAAFWREALESLHDYPDYPAIAPLVEHTMQSGYTRRPLERLFNDLGQSGRRLVLLLDEFEQLLIHPNFQDPAFFALLRSLATRTGGLALITASRLSVAEMNERGRGLLEAGSPFFNNVIEMRLRPFDEIAVGRLLNRAGEAFTLDDRRFIRRVAGRHPFLLQAMAAALAETAGEDRQGQAAERFYEQIAFHFDDLWRSLDDRARTTAVILSLMELGGRTLGQSFAYREIERVDSFGPELRKLAERGLAEQIGKGWQFDWQHLVLWRGERWTVGTQAFAWWVRDVIIAGCRQVPTYDEWLRAKRYRLLLTQEQWDGLVNTVRNAPEWARRGARALAWALFNELSRRV